MEGCFGCDSSTHAELADLESDLGFRITVRDPSGNERELRFDAAGISSDPLQPTTVPAKMARVDLKAPDVESFAFTSSNAGLNEDDFGDTHLVRNGDTLTLSFQTSERLSTSLDVDGTREPVIHFLSGSDEFEASRITIQDGNTDGRSWKAELDIDEYVAALLEDKEGFFDSRLQSLINPAMNAKSASRMTDLP